jgi:hypothetical protein
MARYVEHFGGLSAGFGEPRGMDPNYRDGYHGLRSSGGAGRAPYGMHRYDRRDDLGTMGGFGGIHGGPDRRPDWDGDEEGGLGRDAFRAPRLLRHYNSRSPALREIDGGYVSEELRGSRRELARGPEREPAWMPDRGYRGESTNRGVAPGGFSQSWARPGMPGGR